MFGLKLYAKTKTKKFASDKDRNNIMLFKDITKRNRSLLTSKGKNLKKTKNNLLQ